MVAMGFRLIWLLGFSGGIWLWLLYLWCFDLLLWWCRLHCLLFLGFVCLAGGLRVNFGLV